MVKVISIDDRPDIVNYLFGFDVVICGDFLHEDKCLYGEERLFGVVHFYSKNRDLILKISNFLGSKCGAIFTNDNPPYSYTLMYIRNLFDEPNKEEIVKEKVKERQEKISLLLNQ